MYYSIRHVTRYKYSAPIFESHMELRMQPRSEGSQRCWDFQLRTSPRAKINSYRDSLGNTVHFFDVPARHTKLTITAEARVEYTAPPPLPAAADPESWAGLDGLIEDDDFCELLLPSRFTHSDGPLAEFAAEFKIARGRDPLTTMKSLSQTIYDAFSYTKKSTRVDSPIDEALESRRGVCQDFAHITIALARSLGIPCRYVSGYLFHGFSDDDRSNPGATHAWIEAFLPTIGWVGFDPTNDLIAAERHLRVAVGRDYADVPPTRGVFTGRAESELTVEVQVEPSEAPVLEEAPMSSAWTDAEEQGALTLEQVQQQQQQ